MSEMSALAQLGQDLYDAETKVLELEAQLKRAKANRDRLVQTDIPEAMADIGMSSFSTDKFSIEIKEKIIVSPKVENRPLVLQALEADGQAALIKSIVTVAFNKGQDEIARQLATEMMKKGFDAKQDRSVHAQTLAKYVKDKLSKGAEIDQELFGVRQFKEAKFSSGAPEAPVFGDEDF